MTCQLILNQVSGGKLEAIEHFDSKAEVQEYITSKNIPASFFMPGFFMSNLKGTLQPSEDGNYTLTAPWHPDTKLPMIDIQADTGKYVAAALLRGPSTKRILGVSEWVSPNDLSAAVKEVTGKSVKFTEVPAEVFQGFMPGPHARELTENFVLIRDYAYYGPDEATAIKESQASIEVREYRIRKPDQQVANVP